MPQTHPGNPSLTLTKCNVARAAPARYRRCHRVRGAIALVLVSSLAGCLLACLDWRGVRAADLAFGLHEGERVVFFGDSITQAGGYIADIEAYLLTRFPDKTFTIFNYDQTLERYSEWLGTLPISVHGPAVVDVHGALGDHLRRRRDGRVSFYLSADAVHPGPTGHWLDCAALLQVWHAPALVAEVRIAMGENGPRLLAGGVRDVAGGDDGRLTFVWRSPLPSPADPGWDGRSLELEQFAERFNNYRATIMRLSAARYRMLARLDGESADIEVAQIVPAQTEAGLDLAGLEHFPNVVLAQDVRSRVIKRRQTIDAEWRRRIDRDASYQPDTTSPEFRGGDSELAEIRRLCRPSDIHI